MELKEIINTDNITLDYFNETDEYRISLFDTNSHYIDEIYITPLQLRDLIENGKKLEIKCKDDEF